MIKGIYCKLRLVNIVVTILIPWQWLLHERIPESEDRLGHFPAALRQMEEWMGARLLCVSQQVLCDPAEHYWTSRSCTTHVVKANGFVAEFFRFSVCSCKHPIYLTAVLLLFMTTDLNELPGALQKGLFAASGCFHLCSCAPQKELGFKKVWVSTVVSCHLLLFLLRALHITSTQLWNRALLWLALYTNMPVIKWTVQWEIPARDTKMSVKKQNNVLAISGWVSLQLSLLKTLDF